MSELFQREQFADFGPSSLLPDGSAERTCRVEATRISQLRAQVRQLAPRRPGVYGMLDSHQELIYVGKAKDLRVRLLGYFRSRSRPPKAGKIIRQTATLLWETCPSEFASLLRELELIRRWRPRWNVQGQPLRRRQTFLCLGRQPAPYAYLTPRPPRSNTAVFGPLPASQRTHEAVRRLNDWFRLRDCPQSQELYFPEQGELFPKIRPAGCLRLDLGTCSGPCTGGCKRADYLAQVRRARDFLAGRDAAPLKELQAQMQIAADAQEFERAAAVRDRLTALTWLAQRLDRLRYAQQRMSFVYPVAGAGGTQTWYLIHGARTVAAIARPDSADGKRQARERIAAVYRGQGADRLLEMYEHADGMVLVLAWFQKHPDELKRTLTPQEALARCAG
jgi:excinuclease ABC subunit C